MTINSEQSTSPIVEQKTSEQVKQISFSDIKETVEKMQKEVTFEPAKPKENELYMQAVMQIPFMKGLLSSLNSTGSSITGLFTASGRISTAATHASTGFKFINIALAVVDFFTIPAMYAAAYISGNKPPIELSTTARWLYSAASLGLLIAAAVVPGAAPIIGIVIAASGLAVSVFTMGKFFYDRYQTGSLLNEIDEEIELNQAALKEKQEVVNFLSEFLQGKTKGHDKGFTINKEEDGKDIIETIKRLGGEFDNHREILQGLHDKRHLTEESLETMGTMAVVDKGVGVVLAAVALAGVVLGVFFPPVGLGLIIGAAVFGGIYSVSRVGYPIIKGLLTKSENNDVKKDVSEITNKQAENQQMQNINKNSIEINAKETNSDGFILKQLHGDKKTPVYHQSAEAAISHFNAELDAVLLHHDQVLIYKLFTEIAKYLTQKNKINTVGDVNFVLNSLDQFPAAVDRFKNSQSLFNDEIGYFNSAVAKINANPLLKQALLEKGIKEEHLAPREIKAAQNDVTDEMSKVEDKHEGEHI